MIKKLNNNNICDFFHKKKAEKYLFKLVFYKANNKLNFYFEHSKIISIDLSEVDTSDITSMKAMFFGCHNLKELKGLNNFNTSKVKNMSFMFKSCSELEYLDLSNFDTSNVRDMKFMFYGCNKLKQIKGLNNFNTNNVKNMYSMFKKCKSLESIDLSIFKLLNVFNMAKMFSNCSNLKTINGINKLITENVMLMNSMFEACLKLQYLDLSNFDTSKVIDMKAMFSGCNKLKKIEGLDNFNTASVENMDEMF